MNKKGFTLIELLAIIILIGVLLAIIVSVVDDDLDFAKSFASESQVRLIEESAKMYYLNYKSEIPSIDTNKIALVTVQTLYNKGFVKDKDLNINNKISIKKTDNVIIYLLDEEVGTIYDKTQSTNLIIILNGPKEIKLSLNTSSTEYGAVVLDIVNKTVSNILPGGITGTVTTSIAGTYTVTYSSAGANSITRKIIVATVPITVDNTKPVITIVGSNPITIARGSSYTDAGATATDNKDGNITARITVSGSVNTNSKGTYYINYDVSDSSGNKANTVIRTINVN